MSTEQPISRKERDRRLRETDFLRAAERLFSEKGYFETSMEDVAHAAEYATGTIYRYFDSKEALYQRLLLDKGQSYFEIMKGKLEEAEGPVERLRAMIRGKVRFFFTNREFMRIYMNEVYRPAGSARRPPEGLRDLIEAYRDWWREVLGEGMAQGMFRTLDVERVLDSVTGATNELLSRALNEEQAGEEDLVSFILEFLEGGLVTKGTT